MRPGGGAFAHVPLRLGRMPIHSERVIARAHELGIRVVVWTVDDPATMRSLLDAGVDGIITDHPEPALAARREVGAEVRQVSALG